MRAGVVVNATGVWADDVRALDEASHPHSIRPAKGIHITVPRAKLPADIAAVIPVPKDRRSIFVVPWPDGDDVYLGTTDTAWQGPLDDPACLPDDVDYVLGAANGVITEPIGRHDVTGVWAGLRPLLAPAQGHEVSERTADLSRRHTVRVSAHGMVTVTGGKLTTYRRMAEDTVDVGGEAPRERRPGRRPRCRTKRLRLLGSSGLEALRTPGAAARYGVADDAFAALVGRHGGETPAVLELAAGRPELLEPLVPGLPHLRVEAVWAVRHEMAMTVDDVLSRRTRSVLRRARDAAEAAPGVAEMLAPEWGRGRRRRGARDAAAFAEQARRDLARAGLDPVSEHPVTTPTPVTPVDAAPAAVTDRLSGPRGPRRRRVARAPPVGVRRGSTDDGARAEAGRDWWPLAIRWATRGRRARPPRRGGPTRRRGPGGRGAGRLSRQPGSR